MSIVLGCAIRPHLNMCKDGVDCLGYENTEMDVVPMVGFSSLAYDGDTGFCEDWMESLRFSYGTIVQNCCTTNRELIVQLRKLIEHTTYRLIFQKTGQTHHFWGGDFCGVVTQIFLVRVLR